MTAPPPPLLLIPLPLLLLDFAQKLSFFFFTIVIVKTGKVVHDIQQVYMRTSQAECFENKYLRCYLFVEYTRKQKQQQLACCSLIKHKHRHSVTTACDRRPCISTSLQHAPDPLNLLHTGVRVGETRGRVVRLHAQHIYRHGSVHAYYFQLATTIQHCQTCQTCNMQEFISVILSILIDIIFPN